jgi:hypothetical protein
LTSIGSLATVPAPVVAPRRPRRIRLGKEFPASQEEKNEQGVKRPPVSDGCASSPRATPRVRLIGCSGVASLQQELEYPVKNKVQGSRFNNQKAVLGNLPELIKVDVLEAHILGWGGRWQDLGRARRWPLLLQKFSLWWRERTIAWGSGTVPEGCATSSL